jgi:hypothetical protein
LSRIYEHAGLCSFRCCMNRPIAMLLDWACWKSVLLLETLMLHAKPGKVESHWLLLQLLLFHWIGTNGNISWARSKRCRFTKWGPDLLKCHSVDLCWPIALPFVHACYTISSNFNKLFSNSFFIKKIMKFFPHVHKWV